MPSEIHRLKFRISLKEAHEKKGLSPYMVWKETGISQNTIKKYIEGVETEYIPSAIVVLADFYDVDWKQVVRVIWIDEDDEEPENKALAPAVA